VVPLEALDPFRFVAGAGAAGLDTSDAVSELDLDLEVPRDGAMRERGLPPR